MIIKCVKCKKEFKQKGYERTCGCSRYIKRKYKRQNIDYNTHMSSIRRYFQNPIYQWAKEIINYEDNFNNYKSLIEFIE